MADVKKKKWQVRYTNELNEFNWVKAIGCNVGVVFILVLLLALFSAFITWSIPWWIYDTAFGRFVVSSLVLATIYEECQYV